MTNTEAKRVVRMLRDRFYGHDLSDFEILDKAVASCNATGFTCFFLLLYYQVSEVWPELGLWFPLSCAIGIAVAYAFFKRQRRILLEAREHFIRHTPKNFSELEQIKEN